MTPSRFVFHSAVLPDEAFDPLRYVTLYGCTIEEAGRIVEEMRSEVVCKSDTYQVNRKEVDCPQWGFPLTWLSIKRIDREAFHDWRELQQIKNAVVGAQREAVELYPADARLTDTANQYHLWVLPLGVWWPFGFNERAVSESESGGSRQRPFERGL